MNRNSFTILSYLREDCTPTEQSTPPLAAPQKTKGNKLLSAPKPQISSIPGIPLKERNRYRVTIGDVVLGTQLSIDEALEVAGGAR